MVPIGDSTAGRFMYVITFKYGSSFLSMILVANFCLAVGADGPALPEHVKINGQKVAFWVSTISAHNSTS